MKQLVHIAAILVLIVGTMSGIALAQSLVLYDNFNAKSLNPETGSEARIQTRGCLCSNRAE